MYAPMLGKIKAEPLGTSDYVAAYTLAQIGSRPAIHRHDCHDAYIYIYIDTMYRYSCMYLQGCIYQD